MSRQITVTMDGSSRLIRPEGVAFHRPAGSMTIARSAAINEAQARAVTAVLAGLTRHGTARNGERPANEPRPAAGVGLGDREGPPASLVTRRAVVSEISDDMMYRVTLEVTVDLDAAGRHLQAGRGARSTDPCG